MDRLLASSIVILLVSFSPLRAEDKPAVPQAPADVQIGEARVRILPAITYFHKTFEATLKTLPERIHEAMPGVVKAAAESNLRIVGAPVLIYHGVTADADARFSFDIGFSVADAGAGVKPAGDYKVEKLATFHCISLLYTGDIGHISAAYEKLGAAIPAAHVEPTDESRQMMLYWEAQDSPNNVIQVMIGVK